MRKTFFARRWAAVLLALAMLASMVPAVFAAGERIELSSTSLSLKVGAQETLTYTAYDENGSVDASAVTEVAWDSADSSIAAVQNGVVLAAKAGTTQLTLSAKVNGEAVSAVCAVTVEADAPPESVTPTLTLPASLTLEPNSSKTLAVVVEGTGVTGRGTYVWAPQNDVRIRMSGSGKSITLTPGAVSSDTDITVTVTYTEGSVTLTGECVVTVKANTSSGNIMTGITGTESPGKPAEGEAINMTLKTGASDTLTFALTMQMENGSTSTINATDGNATYTWSSDNERLLTVQANRGSNTATVTASAYDTGNGVIRVHASYTWNGRRMETDGSFTIKVERRAGDIRITPNGPYTMEPNDQKIVNATTDPVGEIITWASNDEEVVTVQASGQGTNAIFYAHNPGETMVTATIGPEGNKESQSIVVTVSGIVLEYDSISLTENEKQMIPMVTRYGAANNGRNISWQSMDNTIAEVSGSSVVGRGPGKTTITAFCGAYTASFTVQVGAGQSTLDYSKTTLKSGDTVKFSSLLSSIEGQVNGNLSYLTSMSVPTNQGTLYYNYISDAQPGQGVAQSESYYATAGSGRKTISNITFVPKPGYSGPVTISYNAVNEAGAITSCRILYNAEQDDGAAFSLSTTYNTAINFNSTEFETACRQATGAQLDYVTFSLPPVRQGSLYTNYVGEGNYGRVVSTQDKFSRSQISDVWFVPAPGFEGTAIVYYTGHAVGGGGKSFSGQVSITVLGEDKVAIGGLGYDVVKGGVAYFDDEDFQRYCREVLNNDGSQYLSFISFDSLPSADQGVLYYDYRSAANTGSRVSAGTTYYYGTRTPRIDRLAFAPAADFSGTIRLPFTGQTTDGTRFAGNVEINVRSSNTGSGNIYYTCQAGKSVTFKSSDFNQLCRERVNARLSSIQFQGLPNSVDGTLYYGSSGSTRVTTGRAYNYGSAYPSINSINFRAANGFSGSVDIQFIGTAETGETFSGIITIDSKSASSSSGNDLHYYADAKNPAVFVRSDFDDLSRWITDRDVSTVKFDVPTSSQGTLYRNYSSMSSKGTQITSNSTSIAASSLGRVAFIPASGFTGTVNIEFTARATNNEEFSGTVEITVERAAADVTVNYTTQVAAIHFRGNDFARSGYTLKSIKFEAMPPSSAGHLYYGYSSPTRYDRQASTGSTYNLTGSSLISDLTFVPKAGFTGTITLPYTGTNSNNTTFEGEVNITVYPTYTSAYFNDMSSYTDAQRSDVDYLYEQGVTSGVGGGRYGPTSSITRGDFALMVYKAFGLTATGSSQFSDVPSSAYYAQAVNTLAALGIVSGVGNGRYSPASQVSREDALIMVRQAMRAVGWSASDGYTSTLDSYSDGSTVSQYAQGAVSYALQMGYLPTTNGRINPGASLSRVDMAAILHRVLTS